MAQFNLVALPRPLLEVLRTTTVSLLLLFPCELKTVYGRSGDIPER